MTAIIVSIFLIFIPLFLARKPKIYIYYVFLVGLIPLTWLGYVPTPVGSLSVSAIKLFGFILSSLIGVGIGIGRGRILAILLRIFPFFPFFFIAIVSIAWSPSLNMGVRMLLKLMAPLMFAIYVTVNLDKIGEKQLLKSIIISGALVIIAAVISSGVGWNKSYLGLPSQSRAVFSSHLMVVISVAVAYAIVFRRIKYIIWSGVISLAILAAFTRITIMGMFASICLMMFIKVKGVARIVFPVIGVIGVVMLFLTVDTFKQRMFTYKTDSISIDSLLNNPDDVLNSIAGSGRFAAWDQALKKMFYPNPTLGSGLGATQFYFYGSGKKAHLGAVHSEYIRLMCDTGIVGLVFYILAWAYAFIRLFLLNASDPYSKVMILASIGAGFAYLIFLATDNGLDYAAQLGNFVYVLVFASLFSSFPSKEEKI